VPGGAQLPEVNKDNPRYRLAIWLWYRFPGALIVNAFVKCCRSSYPGFGPE
jgi:hypothetical protein